MSVILYPFMFCVSLVNGSVCLVFCVSDSVCELFYETIRNVLWCCLVWLEVLYWIDRVWFSKECGVPVIPLCV